MVVVVQRGTGGPTNPLYKSEDTVIVNTEVLVWLMMGIICENYGSVLLEEMALVLTSFCKGTSFSGHFLR